MKIRHLVVFIALAFFLSLSVNARHSKETSSNLKLMKQRHEIIKPTAAEISASADIIRVVAKFKEKSDVRLRGNNLISLKGQSVAEANSILSRYMPGKLSRMFEKPEKELTTMKTALEAKSRVELADFNLYYEIEVTGPTEARDLVNELNKLDIIEIAYVEPRPEPAGDIDPPTPDYTGYQFYLDPAPDGVDAGYANALPGGDGSGVTICDIENYWNEGHEDLDAAIGGTLNGAGNSVGGNHGTAVLGEMIGGDNGYGVTGISPGADARMAAAWYYGTAEAIITAVDSLEPGDVILIELHAPGPRYNFDPRPDQLGYVCMEYWQANFDAMQYAWAKGIIVCEAAGNGSEWLDDPIYENRFDTTFRNSHAIICGAGAPISGNYGTPRSPLDFTNFGERVNLHGYGREVFTTGYGGFWDGDGDANQYYTATFSGTSSASPIVTASVACLQGYYKANFGVPLDADYARDVLVATGTPQAAPTGVHIGPLPNLAAAIPALQPPPSMYADPIFIDTTMAQGDIADKKIWLKNRSNSYGLDFALSDDTLAKNVNWVSVSPTGGTVAPSDSVELTVTLDASILEDRFDVYKAIVNIDWGVTGGTLDSLTQLPIFLYVPCIDDTAFTVANSDQGGGPTFDWFEIKDIGMKINSYEFYNGLAENPLDDGTAGPFALPFDFPFYGNTYNNLYVGVNGGISFTEQDVNSNGYFSNFSIPGNPMTTFIAVFWNDLIIGDDYSEQGAIYRYISPSGDSAVIEWYHVGNFNSSADTMTTFQVILTSWGDIKMQYLNDGITGLEQSALIGVNATGCDAEPYVENGYPEESVITDGMAVEFDSGLAEPVMAGDANSDGSINLLDLTYLINYLYKSGPPPNPFESGDINCDEAVNILDITYLINFLYKDGSDPCYY